jgi:hypothetical protein
VNNYAFVGRCQHFSAVGISIAPEEAEEIPMSRVERTENPSERRGSEQLRQAERGRQSEARREDPADKAEGDERDVDQALDSV